MTDSAELETLREMTQAAVDYAKRPDANTSCLPNPIADLASYIQRSSWARHDYNPADVRGILDRLATADWDDTCRVLTAFARSERFCDGSWLRWAQIGRITAVVDRLTLLDASTG